MVEPPPRPLRRPFTVYLTAEERECLERAVAPGKLGPFMRRVALFRVGWQHYCGVLFEGVKAPAPSRDVGAEAFYLALCAAVELAADALATYRKGRSPHSRVLRMMVHYAKILISFEDFADDMKTLDDVIDLALILDGLGDDLVQHTVAAGTLREAAAVVIEALQKGEPNGQGQRTQA